MIFPFDVESKLLVTMNLHHCIVLLFTSAVLDAGTAEFVWLRDLNNDAGTRHQNVGLPDELTFQLNSGQKSVYLHLKENSHVRADTDMYIVRLMPDGTTEALKETVTGRIENKYYHDIDNRAFFNVRCVKRAIGPCVRTLEGSLIIGEKRFQIAPVSDLNNGHRFYMNLESDDTPHVIQEEETIGEDVRLTKAGDDEDEDVHDSLFVSRQNSDDRDPEEIAPRKSKGSHTVYGVELLVVADPAVWEIFYGIEKNNTQNAMNRVREYVSQVINGVDLWYKSIKDRSFSIYVTLKAILVVKTLEEGPFKNVKPFTQNGTLYIDDSVYLPEFAKWVNNTVKPSNSTFDHAMMFSGYKLANSTGLGYVGGVCTRRGASLVTKADYFLTMAVASHELAHSLGAHHDVVEGCDNGNIMSINIPAIVNETTHSLWEFSNCSINSFEKTLPKKSCVQNDATFYDKLEYDNYNKLYPGQIYGADEQCKILFGVKGHKCSSTNLNTICVSLTCYNPKNRICYRKVAANGTPCGREDNWCIDGHCVSKHPRKKIATIR